MVSKNTALKIIINSLIGSALIFLWLKFIDIKELFQTLSKANLFYTSPIFLLLALAYLLRSFRLKIMLSKVKKVSLKDLFFLNGVAIIFNFFIPIRAGEVAKGLYLNSQYGLPLSKSLIWIFLDRFIDFIVVLVLVGTLVFFIPTNLPASFLNIVGLISIFVVLVFYLMVFQTNLSRKIFKFLTNLLILNIIKIYFERIYIFFLDSFSILRRDTKELLLMILLTAVAYLAEAGVWYFSFLSLGSHQNIMKMFLAQLLSALTYLIPAAPGYVGSAEASALLVFSGIFGIEPNLSSAMVVLFHIATAIFVICFGLLSIYSLKLDTAILIKKIFRRES